MSRTITLSILAGFALALASGGAYAQAKPMPKPAPAAAAESGAADSELNFFANLQDSDVGTTFLVGVALGRFVTEDLELKLTQQLFWFDSSDIKLYSYSPTVSAEYQIRAPNSQLVGFAGGGLGISLGSIETTALGDDFFTYSLFVAPTAGVKYFLDERTALTYTLTYRIPLVEEICGDVDCIDAETTTLDNVFGFSIYY